jgi:pimeloyl-ACP methyl ester carboxylesterase
MPILSEPLTTKEEVADDPVLVKPVLAALEAGNREFMRFAWNNTIFKEKQPSAEDYEIYLDATMKQRNLVDVDYALLTFNMAGRIDEVKCPVVMIHGLKDAVVPFVWAQKSFELVPGAKLRVMDGCGHSPATDEPEAFFNILREELA